MNYVPGKALLSLPFPYIFQIVIPTFFAERHLKAWNFTLMYCKQSHFVEKNDQFFLYWPFMLVGPVCRLYDAGSCGYLNVILS